MPNKVIKDKEEILTPEMQKIVESELIPVKEKLEQLAKENTALKKSEVSLKKSLKEAKESYTQKDEEIASLKEEVRKLGKRNIALIKETHAVNIRAKEAVKEARKNFSRSRAALAKMAAKRLDKAVVTNLNEAFNEAYKRFDDTMTATEESLLQEVGNLLAPYVSDPTIPKKLAETKNELKEMKRAMLMKDREFKIKLQRSEMKVKLMETERKKAMAMLEEAKIEHAKSLMVSKLPETLQETAKEKMAKVSNVKEIRRIYLQVLNEAASQGITDVKPVAASKPVITEGKRQVRSSTKVRKVQRSSSEDLDDIMDPEMMRLAGLKTD